MDDQPQQPNQRSAGNGNGGIIPRPVPLTDWIKVGALIFYAGALTYTVFDHGRRLDRIEARGSPPISEHIKIDDAREARTRNDIDELKKVITSFEAEFRQMRVDVATARLNSEVISKSVERLEKQVNDLSLKMAKP